MKFPRTINNICCDDVIQCVFNLNTLDLNVYKKLKKIGEIRADELAKIMDKDRSTIYRSLQKLTCCRICQKKTNYITKGGYYHTYICKNSKNTKKELERCINNWYKKMRETIKDLDK